MGFIYPYYINGLVQERRNSSALALELRLSCTNPSIYSEFTAEGERRVCSISKDVVHNDMGKIKSYSVSNANIWIACVDMFWKLGISNTD